MKEGEVDRYVRNQRSILEDDNCIYHFRDQKRNILEEAEREELQQ